MNPLPIQSERKGAGGMKMLITDTEPDEVALAEEAWRVAYRDTCTELCTLFNSRCTQYELCFFFDGEYLGVYSKSEPSFKASTPPFKSIFGDTDPRMILTILKDDDYDPFEVLLKTSPRVAKDYACFKLTQSKYERTGCVPACEVL
jgi:hypothetical protein